MAEEAKYNVFMRCLDQDMQKMTGTKDPVSCMHYLRQYKNNGKPPKWFYNYFEL